jgi:hypothetical protein
MHPLFDSVSWILAAITVAVISVAVCLVLLWLLRKAIPAKELKKEHDVVGFTFSIIGVLYSVILGFTVINAQNRYNTVQETIHNEAILLADLYQDASYFPPDVRQAVRASLRNYIEHVIHEEWGTSSYSIIQMKTRALIRDIWDSYYLVDPQNKKAYVWYTESVTKLNSFLNARLSRQFNVWEHLGPMMWSLLILGGIITVCFMFFFGLENMRTHLMITGLLVGYLSFMLFLVYSLDHVYQGPQALKPVALEQVHSFLDQWDQDP